MKNTSIEKQRITYDYGLIHKPQMFVPQDEDFLYLNLMFKEFSLSFQLRTWYSWITAQPLFIGHTGPGCLKRNQNIVWKLRHGQVCRSTGLGKILMRWSTKSLFSTRSSTGRVGQRYLSVRKYRGPAKKRYLWGSALLLNMPCYRSTEASPVKPVKQPNQKNLLFQHYMSKTKLRPKFERKGVAQTSKSLTSFSLQVSNIF